MNWKENELEVEYLSVLRCAYKQLVEQGVRSAYQSHGAHTSSLKIRQGHTFDHNQYRAEFDTLRSSSKRQANYFAFVKQTSSKLLCVRQANVKQITLRSSSQRQANYFAFIKQTSSNRQVCLLRFNVICIRMYVQRYIST